MRSSPIFIHSSFRTGSTWLWGLFRSQPHILAFYEPLNENLLHLSDALISSLRADSWDSGHPSGRPYFAEYRRLQNFPYVGIRHLQPQMVFGDFFAQDLSASIAYKNYLTLLKQEAETAAKVPLYACTRSLGRVAALKNLMGGLHIYLMRDRAAQWQSYLNQLERGNAYFMATLLMIADQNPRAKLVQSWQKRLNLGRLSAKTYPHYIEEAMQKAENMAVATLRILFDELHESLHAHAQKNADIIFDIDACSLDAEYRSALKKEIYDRTFCALDIDSIRHAEAA